MPEWFEKRTIGSLPDEAVGKFGNREALFFKGRRWDFAQIAGDVNRAAKGLISLGIQPGEKVGLWVPNRPEFIHLFFSLAKIGAVVVPINTFFRSSDAAYVLKQANCSTLITVDRSGPIDYFDMVNEMIHTIGRSGGKEISDPDFPNLTRVIVVSDDEFEGTYSWPAVLSQGAEISDDALRRRSEAVDPDETVFIMYTSGTTGFPKGVMHCHNVIRNITDRASRMGITQLDVILMFLPLFHTFGLHEGPLMSMLTGAREVLTERFDPKECLALIEQERVTSISGFDTHLKDLLAHLDESPKDVSSLRTGLAAAGMSSSTPIARKVNEVLCSGMLSAYGMSEIGVGARLSFLTSTKEQRCEASGFPSPGYEIKVIDPANGAEQPTGTPGEIFVRGYMVMQGYYNMPEDTMQAIDNEGWLHTGDMGIMREDGHLRFMGRIKEMLKTGGENVDPMEVEGYLLNHPAIRQVAIVGYPDERLSEVGVAFIQPEPGQLITEADVTRYCKGKIASFKIPRHVIFVQDYPMTGSGKIQKVKLKEQALNLIRNS
ncbi:MAG: AMP-binding protein [Deltaproteobacteria bacterium]|nr:AMP-binding protein [Deltaproteobacteria bacterium]